MEHFRKFVWTAAIAQAFLSSHYAAASGIADAWSGLQGMELFEAVGRDCRPTAYATQWHGTDGLWELFLQTDGSTDGSGFHDPFSGETIPKGSDAEHAPDGCSPEAIVPVRWWGDCENRRFIEADLYNLMVMRNDMTGRRGAYPPGKVDDAHIFDNGIWKIGWGETGGEKMLLWEPPVSMRGDVARIVFYMLALYGEGLTTEWQQWEPFLGNSAYPYLSGGGARQLLVWHRDDPVDERERRRNLIFAHRQGNVNPFVEYPGLAEYFWGSKTDKPLEGGDLEQGTSSPEDDGTPLRPRYSLAEKRINLRSPFAGDDARWSVDGSAVDAGFLVPAALGAGKHELRFVNKTHTGKIIIEIVP